MSTNESVGRDVRLGNIPRATWMARLSSYSRLNTAETALLGVILALIAIMFIVPSTRETFFSSYNLQSIMRGTAITGILALASLMVIVVRGIDLSVGSMLGLASMSAAILISFDHFALPIWVSLVAAIGIGAIVGLYHGFLVVKIGINPLIATLGSMIILRGIINVLADSQVVRNLPPEFTRIGQGKVLGLPNIFIALLISAVLVDILLRRTRLGRNMFAVGSNEDVARLSGVRTGQVTTLAFVFSAVLASIAGLLLTARMTSAVPSVGTGYELQAIAGAVIGGASLMGARGTALGAMLGAVLMSIIVNVGVQLDVNAFVMQIVTGALLTLAVVVDQVQRRKQTHD